MAKLIDSSALLDQIDKYMDMTLYGCTFRGGKIPPMMLEMRQAVLCDMKQLVYSAPTIDAAPVRRSEWVTDDDNTDDWAEPYCKKCGCFIPRGPAHFCPNCGSNMRGEKNETR